MIKVLNNGLYTTIQDLGRFGFRNFGVPVSGVMDAYHAKLANALLDNDLSAAVMEITLQGPCLRFETMTQLVITGASLSPEINKISIKNNTPVIVKPGDTLDFGNINYGVRSYLAVKNGFTTNEVLGSKSFYDGITEAATIKKDDCIAYESSVSTIKTRTIVKSKQDLFTTDALEVYEGPEFEQLTIEQQQLLFKKVFTVGINNRMAYQLNESFYNNMPSIITSGVMPGTVQLTPSGKLIILMADCQTTGGYPRILQLNDKSIGILSQKRKNANIQFKKLSI